mmetsp:Transcript_90288/g.260170  ORF Transcript_90288/g.260170 Transcript_90288/m.260170 type:complete len:184 (-) Transcript_90288:291-842(-)
MLSGAILCLSFGMVCICRSLNTLLDTFCCDVVEHMPVSEVPNEWNVTQAVVRKSSNAIEHGLVGLWTVVGVSLPLTLVEAAALEKGSLLSALPACIVACGVLCAIVMAAAISEKCARIPALINAVSFGPDTERARQHVVDYIVSSAAGFYVLGARLNMAIVLKFLYMWSVVAIGVGTRVVASG